MSDPEQPWTYRGKPIRHQPTGSASPATERNLPRYLRDLGEERGAPGPWHAVTWYGGANVADTPGMIERDRVLARSPGTAAFAHPARVRWNAAGVAEGQFTREDLLQPRERRGGVGSAWEWFVSPATPAALLEQAGVSAPSTRRPVLFAAAGR